MYKTHFTDGAGGR